MDSFDADRLLAGLGPLVQVSARARRRAGCARGSEGLPFAALRVPCDARIPGRWPNSLRSLRSLRSDSRPPVRSRSARVRARPGILCFSAAPTRPAHTPPGALPATILVFDEWGATIRCRPEGSTAVGRLCAAEKRRERGRARTRALRHLTRRRCLSAESAANVASYATGPRYRASQGTRSAAEGKHSEPRRRTALGPAPQPERHALNDHDQPQTAKPRHHDRGIATRTQ
jgi:hypothetical protein